MRMMQEAFSAAQAMVTGMVSFNAIRNRVDAGKLEHEEEKLEEEDSHKKEEETERQTEVAGEEEEEETGIVEETELRDAGIEKVEVATIPRKEDALKKGRLVVNKWKLVEKLGEGGFGVVWSAKRSEKKKKRGAAKKEGLVALKFEVCRTRSLRGGKQVFLPESSSDLTICDLKHEFKILSMLKAVKGVSRPLEFIDAGHIVDGDHGISHSCLVLPLLSNNLECVKTKTKRSFAAEMGRQLLGTLEACHMRGVAHCDISPGNIMQDSQGRFILVDWGLSKIFECQDGTLIPAGGRSCDPYDMSARDHDGSGCGTAEYMSYRVFKGKTNAPRDDLESMVLVMIEIASEQLPWCMVDTLGPPGENDGDAFGEKSAFGRARDRYKDAKDLCSGMHKGFENLFNCVRDMDLFNCNHEALRKLLYKLDNDLSSVAWEVTNKRKGVTHAVRQHSIDSNKENRRPALNRNKRLKLHDD